MIWWHRFVLRHEVHYHYHGDGVSVRCDCLKRWVLC